ncbi:MAG TPA: tetratricopeptide repeat protein, partial [Terriglobales bacterium]|nr:tetratricopeptide repeat protein [Terriglobales bacterium]
IALLLILSAGAVRAVAQNAKLDEARTAAGAGKTEEAIQLYRDALEAEPQNTEALAAEANLLEGAGKWRDAVPYLEKLVTLEPKNLDAVFRLGRMKSWEPDQRSEALSLLRRACEESDHNLEYCSTYSDVLSWKAETRSEAIAGFKSTLAAHPEATASRLRLAQILSWSDATRPEALRLYDEGLQLDPKNTDLLMASAEVLSWRGSTRNEAIARYDRVLQQDPDNAQALDGKAQLLAWQNRSPEALALYKRVLAKDPKNPAALRGEAEILNWKGRYAEARDLAKQAHKGAPDDQQSSLELARADIGLRKFADARDALAGVTGATTPELNEARQQIHRGLGTYVEFGYVHRLEHNNLDFDRLSAALSTPLNAANRLTFTYSPTLSDGPRQSFNSNYFEAALDSDINERTTSHVQLGADLYPNAPVNVDGGVDVRYKVIASTTLKFDFQRAALEETELSTRGEKFNGTLQGQVRSNLADLGVSYNNSPHKFDLSLDYSDGVYTGRNIDSNRRYLIEGDAGKSLRGDKPYIRVGYDVTYISFDHDADIQTAQPFTRATGGYFSPTRFLLNQGVLNVSHNFNKDVQWSADGAAGAQNVQTTGSDFGKAQFASSFDTHVMWRVTPVNELRFGYAYLNVFNAFQRHLFQFSWRHYL